MLFQSKSADTNVLDLGNRSQLPEVLKKVLGNKYVIGGAVIGTALKMYEISKLNIGTAMLGKLLPNFATIAGVTFMGIPIGSVTMAYLGALTAGTVLATAVGTLLKVRQHPEQKIGIIIDSAIGIGIMIIAFYFLGDIGADLIESARSFNFYIN
jgi:hypothetical protein